MRHIKALASLLTLLLVLARPAAGTAQATAQPETYRWDLGAALGMAGYLGDANDSRLFSHPSLSAAASLRYLINTRFALRALLTYSSLSGSTADMDNVIPSLREEPYSFKSSLTDFQVRGEYNFMPYGIGESYKQLRRFSPYLALGLGLSVGSCEGKSHAALSIPMAVGVKYKLRPRINLGLEFAMTKLLGDRLDGPVLDDPYLIKSSFLKNTDWYSTIAVSISYEFGERCIACNRQD